MTSQGEQPAMATETVTALRAANLRLALMWKPPQILLPSEWAEKNIVLTRERSARPGPLRLEKFQIEPLDAFILDRSVRRIVWKKSTQVGYSESLNALIAYFIDMDPKPQLLVEPTEQFAKNYSKKRIAPMIEGTACLRAKVKEATSRKPGNTMLQKEYPGGFLRITGANSPTGLRSDPIANLYLDEIEAYPPDVGGEGDPIEIAEQRTGTFDDARIVLGSTPGRPAGFSRIEEEYEASSQGVFFVPCPFCGFEQPLVWRDEGQVHRLKFEKEKGEVVPGSVRYLCANCDVGIDEKFKQRMIDGGRWVHKFPERREVRGFYLNALYAPWKPIWEELARKWVKAYDNPEKLKAFITLQLGQAWNEGADDTFKPASIRNRVEDYAADVPDGVGCLVAAADIQHNRIEVQVIGFGDGEEAWLIQHEIFYGDPSTSEADSKTGLSVWEELDEFLLREWKTVGGLGLRPAIAFVDSGDSTDAVYDFVLARQVTIRRVFACKGFEFLPRPGLVLEGTGKRSRIRVWNVGTTAAKDRLYARLKIQKVGKEFIHFPKHTPSGYAVTDEYFDQIFSEKKITVRDRRTRALRRIYVKQHGRNEALDMWVYSLAALSALQILDPSYRDLGALAEKLRQGVKHVALRRVRRIRMAGQKLP
jgi:phage terminase large subunit GpA-like protein